MYKYLESKVFTRSGKIHETKKRKREQKLKSVILYLT